MACDTAATDCYVPVPDHVADRHGNVWRVVRDGGMVTRAEYDGVESCGITYAESVYGPLRPVYVNGGPDGLAVEPGPKCGWCYRTAADCAGRPNGLRCCVDCTHRDVTGIHKDPATGGSP